MTSLVEGAAPLTVPVDRTLVVPGAEAGRGLPFLRKLLGKEVHFRERCDLFAGQSLDHIITIPPTTIQVEPMDKDTVIWRIWSLEMLEL